jgi:hypothetical protein
LATAIRGRVDVIVTSNLKDFPAHVLKSYGIEPQHPDEFILNLLDLAPSVVVRAARDHLESLRNPPRTIEEYLDALKAAGLTRSASVLRELML